MVLYTSLCYQDHLSILDLEYLEYIDPVISSTWRNPLCFAIDGRLVSSVFSLAMRPLGGPGRLQCHLRRYRPIYRILSTRGMGACQSEPSSDILPFRSDIAKLLARFH